jgi:hypothetical protein
LNSISIFESFLVPLSPQFSSPFVDLPNGEVPEVPVSEAHLIPPVLVQRGPQNDAASDRVCVRLMQHPLQVRGLRLRI